MVVSRTTRKLGIAAAVLIVAAASVPGCGNIQAYFNPTFLSTLGMGESVANQPGEAPAIILEIENETNRVIEARLTWRDGEGEIQERTRSLGAGDKYAEAIICPIEELTLGDVGAMSETGVIIRMGFGGPNDAYLEVEPFGVLLQQGVNYDCGDTVTFKVMPSSATLSGYQTFAFIRRS